MALKPSALGLKKREKTGGISAEVSYTDQLAIIKKVKRDVKTLGVLFRSSSESSKARVESMRSILPDGLALRTIDLDAKTNRSEIEAIRSLISGGIDVMWTLPDRKVYNSAVMKAVLLTSLRHKVIVFGFSTGAVRAGATIGVGTNPKWQGNRVAMMLNKKEYSHKSAKPILVVNWTVCDRINRRLPKSIKPDIAFGKEN